MNRYLAPGAGKIVTKTVEFQCSNPDCGNHWSASGEEELGGLFLHNEELWNCPECGTEGIIE